MKHITRKTRGENTIKVEINLDHNFSITGSIREKGEEVMGGCIHDEILEHFPMFKTFVDLHLSNEYGQPMYALANGIYHMKKDKKVAMNYLRIDEKEHDELINFIDSEEAFLYKLVDLDIVQRRNKEAQKAIKKLNFLTGKIHEYKEEDDLTMTTESLKN